MRAIDADALMTQFDIWDECDELFVQSIRTEIEHAPTIEPEPQRTGRWVNVRNDNIAECDQCGITGRAWMNFCFGCGADMREGES